MKINQEIQSYLSREHEKVLKKLAPLLKRKFELEEAFRELTPEPVPNVVLVTIFNSTAKMITRDNITGYPINKNPNVKRDIEDMLKNKQTIRILDDSRNEEEYKILEALSKKYDIPMEDKV